jgi:ABC-2 type transport system permease protein
VGRQGALLLICWAFSGAIYTAATATSQELHNAPVAVVDEDQSLSRRIVGAFYRPISGSRPP